MWKLMKLEAQRVNLRTYLICSAVFGAVMLVFTYFVAFVAQVEQEAQFMTYNHIFQFTSAISILLFGILSATMYARVVIGAYSGKQLALLFSYPVNRKKILLAKVLVVFSFILIAMLLCTVIPVAIFAVTESFAPIVSDAMTAELLAAVSRAEAASLIAVSAIGILAMRIGFAKRSVSITLISAFLLSGLYGNISIGSAGEPAVSMSLIGLSLVAAVAALVTLSIQIDHMEVV